MKNSLAWSLVSRGITVYSTPPTPNGSTALIGPEPPHYQDLTITLRHTVLGSTSLDEWSARHRILYLTTHNTTDLYLTTHNTTDLYLTTHNTTDLYLTTHNTHNRQTSKPWVRFEPTISADERP